MKIGTLLFKIGSKLAANWHTSPTPTPIQINDLGINWHSRHTSFYFFYFFFKKSKFIRRVTSWKTVAYPAYPVNPNFWLYRKPLI
jgi:hypothetical protein